MSAEQILFGTPESKLGDRGREVVGEAIRDTDWERDPVVDVVVYRSVARSDEPNRPEYETYRPDGVPDYSEYADPARTHTVYRITEDRCEEMGVDPETGDGIETALADESVGDETDENAGDGADN
jgi:hypothetical protein